MPHLEIEDFEIKVTKDVITPGLLWEARFSEFERYRTSQRIYDKMSLDEKEAIILRLKKAIGVMYDTVSDWIPDSLSLSEDGSCVKIEFNLLLNKVEFDVETKNKATTFSLNEVRKEIELLLEDEA